MSDRTTALIETVKALAQVQQAGNTFVDKEIRAVIAELLVELNLKV